MMDQNEQLDPGIRDIVLNLRLHGFETTDSGDGVSKTDMECALPFPNVAARTTRGAMCDDADRMAVLLGEGWHVEASYSTADGTYILLGIGETPKEIA